MVSEPGSEPLYEKRERHPPKLGKVVELFWICECVVCFELTACIGNLSRWSHALNAHSRHWYWFRISSRAYVKDLNPAKFR